MNAIHAGGNFYPRPKVEGQTERNDRDLVRLVEEFGPAAAGPNAELTIVEIPDGSAWKISEVVGYEYVVVNGNIS